MTNRNNYIDKLIINVTENLRAYVYYYRSGARVYFVPKNESEETTSVWIGYPPVLDGIVETKSHSDAL